MKTVELNPAKIPDAVTIVDQMLQPGVHLDRQAYGVAEVCIRTIRAALTPPDPPKEPQ